MIALIVGGPHGSGKDAVIDAVLERDSRFRRVVRHITRVPSPTELDGRDYFFVDMVQFEAMVLEGAFAESSRHADSCSGTSWSALEADSRIAAISLNFDDAILLERALRARGWTVFTLFVSPVAADALETDQYLSELRDRMRSRGRATDRIEVRLEDAAEYRNLYLASEPRAILIENTHDGLADAVEKTLQIFN